MSALKEERVAASKVLQAGSGRTTTSATKKAFIDAIRDALYASKIVSYAQGYMLMRAAAKAIQVEPELRRHRAHVAGRVHHPQPRSSARSRRRSTGTRSSSNLLLDPFFTGEIERCQPAWRQVIATAVMAGHPGPGVQHGARLLRRLPHGRLPANLLQAQRDYFGAHTYERVDKPRGEFFHTNWTGRGGKTASGSYTV